MRRDISYVHVRVLAIDFAYGYSYSFFSRNMELNIEYIDIFLYFILLSYHVWYFVVSSAQYKTQLLILAPT